MRAFLRRSAVRRVTRTSFPRQRAWVHSRPRGGVSHVTGPKDSPLLQDSLGSLFAAQCVRHTTDELLVDCEPGSRFTWLELQEAVHALTLGLSRLGLERGDRVGIWMPNQHEWVVVFLACAHLGLVSVNVNNAYEADELRHALNLVQCKALFLTEKFRHLDNFATLYALCPELKHGGGPAQPHKGWHFEQLPHLRHVIHDGHTAVPGMHAYTDLLDTPSGWRSRVCEPPRADAMNDVVNIQFTSGTTGRPKGAALHSLGLLNNARHAASNMDLVPGRDVLCISVPLMHCFGTVLGMLASIVCGNKFLLPCKAFDAKAVLQAVTNERATALHGVPTMFIAELEQLRRHPSAYDVSTLRTGIMAGSVCPPPLLEKCIQHMNLTELTVGYGQTETSPLSFMSHCKDEDKVRTSTVGRVLSHVEAKIVPEDGSSFDPVPVGTVGELWTRGYIVMNGYWGNEEATAMSIHEGWMKTGDLARFDESGYCSIAGRSKDLIIRGGENVFPKEVEDVLLTHPDVQDVAVISVPDDFFGEEICAWISPHTDISPESIVEHCKGRLSHNKVPRWLHVTSNFPVTATGKHQKYLMRQESQQLLAQGSLIRVTDHGRQPKQKRGSRKH